MSSKILLLCTTTGVTALRSDTNTDQAGGADSSGSALPPCSTLSWWSRPFTKCATESTAQVTTTTTPGQENGSALPQCSTLSWWSRPFTKCENESTAQVTTTTTPGQENGSALPQCSTLSWWSRPFTKCENESTAQDQVTTSAAPVEEAPEAQDAKTTPAQETTTPPVAQAPKKSKLTFKEAVSSVFRNPFRKKEKKNEDPKQLTEENNEKKTMWDHFKNVFSSPKKEKKPENSDSKATPLDSKANVAAEEDTSNMNDPFPNNATMHLTVDAPLKLNDTTSDISELKSTEEIVVDTQDVKSVMDNFVGAKKREDQQAPNAAQQYNRSGSIWRTTKGGIGSYFDPLPVQNLTSTTNSKKRVSTQNPMVRKSFVVDQNKPSYASVLKAKEMREEHIANFKKEQKIAEELAKVTEELEKEHVANFRKRQTIARLRKGWFAEAAATIHKLQ